MSRRLLRLVLPLALVLPVAAAVWGGWAVITIQDLPDHATAAQPLNLTFAVRQHGIELLEGLAPRIEATNGRATVQGTARSSGSKGHYAAAITLPSAGDWTITVYSGFGHNKVTLFPLTAVAPGTKNAPVIAAADRGRHLFVAKGCVTCHVHSEARTAESYNIGPELTGRRYPSEYLKGWLANPKRTASAPANRDPMPNLGLKEREIASLVAFINNERQVSTR